MQLWGVLAQVRGSCTLWQVQGLRLDSEKNSMPKQAAVSLMPWAHYSQFLTEKPEGQNCTSCAMLRPRKVQTYTHSSRRAQEHNPCPQPPVGFLLEHKDCTLLLSLQHKLQCVNEGEHPLLPGCWWGGRQPATLPRGLPREPSRGLGIT